MNGTTGTVLYAVLMAGLLYLVKQTAGFLKAKTLSTLGDERLRDKEIVKIGLDIAEKAIRTATEAAVGKLEEIIGKDLRKKVKNGEADKSELCALAMEAYSEVVKTIGPELMQELSESMENVDLYIHNQIEHQLLLLKAKLNGGAAGE